MSDVHGSAEGNPSTPAQIVGNQLDSLDLLTPVRCVSSSKERMVEMLETVVQAFRVAFTVSRKNGIAMNFTI